MAKFTVVIYAYFAQGHYLPVIPIIKDLIGRGATVHIIYSELDVPVLPDHKIVSEFFRSIGAFTAPIPVNRHEFSSLLEDIDVQRNESSAPSSSIDRVLEGFAKEAYLSLGGLLSLLERINPDLFVYDKLCLAAQVAAKSLQIPSAMIHPSYCAGEFIPEASPIFGIPPSRDAETRIDAYLKLMAASMNVTAISVKQLFSDHPSKNVVFQSPEFHPLSNLLGDEYAFVGPQLNHYRASQNAERDTIYVSLGTLYGIGQEEFFWTCMESLGGFNCRVVVSTGELTSLSNERNIPGGVEVFSSVNQLDILSRSKAFITHGGMNSVQEAIWTGAPMVVVPQAADQHFTARRICDLDCGVAVRAEAVEHSVIAGAVEFSMNSDDFQRGLVLQRSYAVQAGGTPRAVDELMSMM